MATIASVIIAFLVLVYYISMIFAPEWYKIKAVVQRCSVKSDLKNFAKFLGKHLCQSLFFNKVTDLRPAAFLKRDPGKDVFLRIFQNI